MPAAGAGQGVAERGRNNPQGFRMYRQRVCLVDPQQTGQHIRAVWLVCNVLPTPGPV